MVYWVHGRDEATGHPHSELFSADSPDDARQQAAGKGLIAETIQLDSQPVAEHIHRSVLGPRHLLRFRFKIIGFVLFIAGVLACPLMTRPSDVSVRSIAVITTAFQLFFVAFACWTAGCVFQSETWKNFKLGCGMGIVMTVIAVVSMLALVPK